MSDLFAYDTRIRNQGYTLIAGVDEAGRGPLAGPVVASAVILPPSCHIEGIKDSKKLSPKKRAQIYDIIKQEAVDIGIGIVDVNTIDRINILQASMLAMKTAILNLKHTPEYLLIDGPFSPNLNIAQLCVINGDNRSAHIAAASIVAKVTRDSIMINLHKKYPAYSFDKHKGYGTSFHMSMLKEHGPCEIHRRSFAPVRRCEDIKVRT
ncbi:MAG: ribonuclease HII [bacterium]